LRVALRRAAHQVYDAWPLVFEDALAVRILAPDYLPELEKTATKLEKPHSVALRAFLVARSRYAEDLLAAAVTRGVRQYVLLGAGLDTFGYRSPHTGVRVFEVDHPATQQWKRERLAQNEIFVPDMVTYVAVDFEPGQKRERERLPMKLREAGFDAGVPTLFAWLGVVPYLTLGAFRETVGMISACAAGSGVVFDYSQPRAVLPLREQLEHDSLRARVALAGEPLQLFFTPEEVRAELAGFQGLEDLGAGELNARYFEGRGDGLRLMGAAGRVVSGWV